MRTWIIAIVAGIALAISASHAPNARAEDQAFERLVDDVATFLCEQLYVKYELGHQTAQQLRAMRELDRWADETLAGWGDVDLKSAGGIAAVELRSCKRSCANGLDFNLYYVGEPGVCFPE